ncbi:MAG: M18 family aminopeptidase, partial [Pseudomonadota bacterium]|nr:M18 family aminopeptidase [Pseudomonadota bacterium]
MDKQTFNQQLMAFLDASPTPFHAASNMAAALDAAGFIALDERDDWSLEAGRGYYTLRNGASIVAFRVGQGDVAQQGWKMVGAHTDSPCLKVKPNPVLHKKGYFQLGVDVYGGALLNP